MIFRPGQRSNRKWIFKHSPRGLAACGPNRGIGLPKALESDNQPPFAWRGIAGVSKLLRIENRFYDVASSSTESISDFAEVTSRNVSEVRPAGGDRPS
jgi:hypothetical protein